MAPSDVALSSLTYVAPSTANQVVGTLSSTDANTGQTYTYTITGGANAAMFNVSGSQLRITNAGVTGGPYAVIVRSTDNGTGSLWFEKTFNLTERCVSLLCAA